MLQYLASCILYTLVLVVTAFSSNAAQQWVPERKDLEVMSLRSAVIVDVATLLVIAGIVYLIVRAVR